MHEISKTEKLFLEIPPRDDLIKLLTKYIRKTGEYKPVLVDLLNLDLSAYLEKKNIY